MRAVTATLEWQQLAYINLRHASHHDLATRRMSKVTETALSKLAAAKQMYKRSPKVVFAARCISSREKDHLMILPVNLGVRRTPLLAGSCACQASTSRRSSGISQKLDLDFGVIKVGTLPASCSCSRTMIRGSSPPKISDDHRKPSTRPAAFRPKSRRAADCAVVRQKPQSV